MPFFTGQLTPLAKNYTIIYGKGEIFFWMKFEVAIHTYQSQMIEV